MPLAARVGVDTAGGVQLGGGQDFITIQGALWVVRGDPNAPHGRSPHVPGPDNMVGASSFVSINGIPVCRAGDAAGCGHVTTGSGHVDVNA